MKKLVITKIIKFRNLAPFHADKTPKRILKTITVRKTLIFTKIVNPENLNKCCGNTFFVMSTNKKSYRLKTETLRPLAPFDANLKPSVCRKPT